MDSQGIHFHIQWSSDSRLDWERFGTSAKAIERAASMVNDGETFTIEQRDDKCERCAESAKRFAAS